MLKELEQLKVDQEEKEQEKIQYQVDQEHLLIEQEKDQELDQHPILDQLELMILNLLLLEEDKE